MSQSEIYGHGGAFAITDIKKNGYECRAFAESWPTLRHMYDAAVQYNDRPFIQYEKTRYTYKEALTEAKILATVMHETFHVQSGDRVAIAMQNNPEWMISYIAVTGLGAIVVPINSWGAGEEILHTLNDLKAKLVVLDPKRLARVEAVGELPCAVIVARDTSTNYPQYAALIDKCPSDGNKWPTPCPSSADHTLILFTSGTTGRPKGAMFTHHAVGQSLKNIALSGYFLGAEMQQRMMTAGIKIEAPKDFQPSALLTFPLFHIAASHAVFLQNIQIGGRIVMLPKWDPQLALQLIDREKITSFSGVPAMLWDVIHHPDRDKYSTASLIAVGIGGAAETPEGFKRIKNTFPQAVPGTGYGLSEAGGTVATIVGNDLLANSTAVGKPLPSCEVRIVTSDGHEAEIGEQGEILIKSAAVFSGYWNNPEETDNMLKHGWLHSGDLGHLDADGRLYITGRVKDMVISGGENIPCPEIEFLLQEHASVSEVAAIGLNDERLGEKLAVVILRTADHDLTMDEVQSYVSEHLAHFKMPQEVIFTETSFPRTALGKIIKSELKDQLGLE